MRTQVYAGEALARYGFPGGHPFSTKRFGAFYDEFLKRDLPKRSTVVNPHEGDPQILAIVTDDVVEVPIPRVPRSDVAAIAAKVLQLAGLGVHAD